MVTKEELLELSQEINKKSEIEKNKIILLHTKAHLYHNKKMHDKVLELMKKHNIKHVPYDNLDNAYK